LLLFTVNVAAAAWPLPSATETARASARLRIVLVESIDISPISSRRDDATIFHHVCDRLIERLAARNFPGHFPT